MEIQFYQKPYSKRILQKQDQKSLLKNFSLSVNNGEENVKIKGLHYVNQWYDDTKIIYEILVMNLTRLIFA